MAWVWAFGMQIMYISGKSSINIPFSFIYVHKIANKITLLNSGAMENFMNKWLVKRLGIG